MGIITRWLPMPQPRNSINGTMLVTNRVQALNRAPVRRIRLPFNFRNRTISQMFRLLQHMNMRIPRTATRMQHNTRLPRRPIRNFDSSNKITKRRYTRFFHRVRRSKTQFRRPGQQFNTTIRRYKSFEIQISVSRTTKRLVTFISTSRPNVMFDTTITRHRRLFRRGNSLSPIQHNRQMRLRQVFTS